MSEMSDRRGGFSISRNSVSRISISRIGPGLRQGLFVAGLAGALLVAGLPAGAHTPETGSDPTVTLTVNPDEGLTDGQTVTVTGTGFPANASGLIRECGGSVALPECDTIVSGFFITDGAGAIPPSPMTVNRVITTFTTTYNCGVQACALVATAGGKSSRHHISFAGAGTVPPTTSATTVPGATTVPTTAPGATTVPTTVPGATTVPTTVPPSTTIPPAPENLLCAIVRALGQALPGILGGLANGLLSLLGCAPLAG